MYSGKLFVVFFLAFFLSGCAVGPKISGEYMVPKNARYLVHVELLDRAVHRYQGVTRFNDYTNHADLDFNVSEVIFKSLQKNLPKGYGEIKFTTPDSELYEYKEMTNAYGFPDKISKNFHKYLKDKKESIDGDVLIIMKTVGLVTTDERDYSIVGIDSNVFSTAQRIYSRVWVQIFDLRSNTMIATSLCGDRSSEALSGFDDSDMGEGVRYRLIDLNKRLYSDVVIKSELVTESCIGRAVAALPS
jgi:hypothetical protein